MEEPIKVKKIEIEGKKYLIDKRTNILYDRETQEPIGVLQNDKIIYYDDDEPLEKIIRIKIGDFGKLDFTKVPEKYWTIDNWDYNDMLDYLEDKNKILISKPINFNNGKYQLVIKKNDKKFEPIGVVIIDEEDDEMLFFNPETEFNMFLQYFGEGDIINNLLEKKFINQDISLNEKSVSDVSATDNDLEEQYKRKLSNYIEIINKMVEEYKKTHPLKKGDPKNNELSELRLKLKQEISITKKLLSNVEKEFIDYMNSKTGKGITLSKPKVALPNPCWKNYEPIGMKKKGKKLVPNCVPIKTTFEKSGAKEERTKIGIQAEKIPKTDEIWKWSNPDKVAEMAKKYLGDMAVVFRSTKPKKKYMIFDPIDNKWIFFGELGFEDFTKHQDPKRRENYLKRATNIKGNWKKNRYSANNLAINILW